MQGFKRTSDQVLRFISANCAQISPNEYHLGAWKVLIDQNPALLAITLQDSRVFQRFVLYSDNQGHLQNWTQLLSGADWARSVKQALPIPTRRRRR